MLIDSFMKISICCLLGIMIVIAGCDWERNTKLIASVSMEFCGIRVTRGKKLIFFVC